MTKNPKFEMEGYNIQVVGKRFQVTDAIRNYVLDKLSKIDRFADHILDVVVTLDVQKLEHSVDIVMKFNHFQIKVHSSMENIYSAIDKASYRVMRLIKKYKQQLQEHRAANMGTIDLNVNVLEHQRSEEEEIESINDAIEDLNFWEEVEKYKPHEVVAQETITLPILNQDEAVMKMELSGDNFMVYRAEENQKLRVIYRRDDDNFGIIEAEK